MKYEVNIEDETCEECREHGHAQCDYCASILCEEHAKSVPGYLMLVACEHCMDRYRPKPVAPKPAHVAAMSFRYAEIGNGLFCRVGTGAKRRRK